MTKAIVAVILILLAAAFLVTYEGFNLLYYEEQKADRYADIAITPFLLYYFVSFVVQKYKSSIKDNRVADVAKQAVILYPLIIVFYIFMIRPVISGLIIFTNDIFKTKEEITLSGIVSRKLDVAGPKIGNFEFEVKTDNNVYWLDTNGVNIDKYKVGDTFNETMTVGCWGLLTKEDQHD